MDIYVQVEDVIVGDLVVCYNKIWEVGRISYAGSDITLHLWPPREVVLGGEAPSTFTFYWSPEQTRRVRLVRPAAIPQEESSS